MVFADSGPPQRLPVAINVSSVYRTLTLFAELDVVRSSRLDEAASSGRSLTSDRDGDGGSGQALQPTMSP